MFWFKRATDTAVGVKGARIEVQRHFAFGIRISLPKAVEHYDYLMVPSSRNIIHDHCFMQRR